MELVKVARHIDYSKHMVYNHGNLETFLNNEKANPGIHSIHHNGIPIDFQFSPVKDSEYLVIVLHGAAEKNVHLPWLSGVGITQGLRVSRLFVSDPSLYLNENLNLAWFSGNLHQPYLQRNLVEIFEKFRKSSGAKTIVFLGGSGGGFASLLFSFYLRNSIAIVFNPQTILSEYPRHATNNWAKLGWDKNSLEDLDNHILTDLTNIYSTQSTNKIFYLQNSTDQHFEKHFIPFLSRYAGNNLYTLIGNDWGEGHVPPPKNIIRNTLIEVLSNEVPTNFSRQ